MYMRSGGFKFIVSLYSQTLSVGAKSLVTLLS